MKTVRRLFYVDIVTAVAFVSLAFLSLFYFIDFVDDKGAFTPNQVAMIFWRMGSAGVNYRPADWKVRMRRDSDWRQLRTMKPAAFKRVIAALTPAQRRRVAEIEANFSENGQRWR